MEINEEPFFFPEDLPPVAPVPVRSLRELAVDARHALVQLGIVDGSMTIR